MVFATVALAAVLVVGLAMIAIGMAHHSRAEVDQHFATIPQVYRPAPMALPDRTFVAPSPTPTVDPPAAVAPTTTNYVDLWTDPLAAYAGGPSADRLTVHGLGIGIRVAGIPAALLLENAPDHLRDTGGNLYAVDDGQIAEIHIRDPQLLARMPIDGSHALFARFGPTGDVYREEGSATYLYPARGIHVRWDNAAGRIAEVVLVRPAVP